MGNWSNVFEWIIFLFLFSNFLRAMLPVAPFINTSCVYILSCSVLCHEWFAERVYNARLSKEHFASAHVTVVRVLLREDRSRRESDAVVQRVAGARPVFLGEFPPTRPSCLESGHRSYTLLDLISKDRFCTVVTWFGVGKTVQAFCCSFISISI